MSATPQSAALDFRNPTAADGAAIWRFVAETGVLEQNTAYAYMLMCRHFSATSIVAIQGEALAGFVMAYCPPQQSDTVFVWQVGVASAARGQGLGVRLLEQTIAQPACRAVHFLEASVTSDNEASMALFRALARRLDVACTTHPFFDRTLFPESHASEDLFRVGPFEQANLSGAS